MPRPESLRDRIATIIHLASQTKKSGDEVAGEVMALLGMRDNDCEAVLNAVHAMIDESGFVGIRDVNHLGLTARVDRLISIITAQRAEIESLRRAYVRPDDLRAQLDTMTARAVNAETMLFRVIGALPTK